MIFSFLLGCPKPLLRFEAAICSLTYTPFVRSACTLRAICTFCEVHIPAEPALCFLAAEAADSAGLFVTLNGRI